MKRSLRHWPLLFGAWLFIFVWFMQPITVYPNPRLLIAYWFTLLPIIIVSVIVLYLLSRDRT